MSEKPLVNQKKKVPIFIPIRPKEPEPQAKVQIEGKGGQLEMFETEHYVFSSQTMIEFMEVWNGTMVLPKIVSMIGRENNVRAAMRDKFFRDNWREGIRKVAASKFCRGGNRMDSGHAWRADADWFLQPHVLPRVIEGKYDDKETVKPEDLKYDKDTID